jgi:hypothetical protein
MRNAYKILSEKLQGKKHFGALDVDGRILKLTLEKQDVRVWAGFKLLG